MPFFGSDNGNWKLLRDIKLTSDTNNINITGLGAYGCDMFMVEGFIIPDTLNALYPHYQFNGITTANYAYIYGGFTATGLNISNIAQPGGPWVNQVQFGPLMSSAETSFVKMLIRAEADNLGLLAFHSELRTPADWHLIDGAIHGLVQGDRIDSIRLFSQAPFAANVYATGTHLKVSGFF